MPARKDKLMKYKQVFQMLDSIPYLSVGPDVGSDFTWMSIALPNGAFIGKPFKNIVNATRQHSFLPLKRRHSHLELCVYGLKRRIND